MPIYMCTDGNGDIEIEADSALEAAQEFVDGGDWGEITKTSWVTVYVTEKNPEISDLVEAHTIELNPDEPKCEEGEHDWRSPYSVLGGIKENPGVWGNGGGVIIREVCCKCGCYKITNTWDQNPENGEQGLTSVSYEEADELSLEYVESNKEQTA